MKSPKETAGAGRVPVPAEKVRFDERRDLGYDDGKGVIV